MKKLSIIFVLAICFQSLFGSTIVEKFPADAKVVARFDMERLRKSEFFQNYRKKNPLDIDMPFGFFALVSGISPDEINKVWMLGYGKEDGILIFEGLFQPERIKQLLSSDAKNEVISMNDVLFAVVLPDQKRADRKNLGVIIDEKTIAVGRMERVESLISCISGTVESISLEKAEELKKKFADNSVIHIELFQIKSESEKNPMLNYLMSADFSIFLDKELEVFLNLYMIDEEIALATQQIINGITIYLKRFEIENNPHSKMLNLIKSEMFGSMNCQLQDKTVKIKLKASANLLDKIIEERSQKRGNSQNNRTDDNQEQQ